MVEFIFVIVFIIIFSIAVAFGTRGIKTTILNMKTMQEQQGELIIQQNGEIIELLHEISEQNKIK